MSLTGGLAEIEELVDADAAWIAAALALIVAEALAEDLGGRGVLPPGTGAGVDVTSVATIPADDVGSRRVRRPAGRGLWPEWPSPRTWSRWSAHPRANSRSISIAETVPRSYGVMY